MRKLLSNDKLKLFAFVMAAHVFTYFACGLIFSQIMNYDDKYLQLLGFRPMDELALTTKRCHSGPIRNKRDFLRHNMANGRKKHYLPVVFFIYDRYFTLYKRLQAYAARLVFV